MAPDVFVVLGANSADRCTYLLWEEPKAPDFVLEITSCSTRHEDQVIKRDLYRSLGVREYFLFDPTNDYLKPPLQGLELVARDYRRLPARELAEGGLALASAMLGLELRVTERGLRFHDPHAGEDLPNYAETAQWRERPARLEAKSLLAQEIRGPQGGRSARGGARSPVASGRRRRSGRRTTRLDVTAAGQWPLRSPGRWPGRGVIGRRPIGDRLLRISYVLGPSSVASSCRLNFRKAASSMPVAASMLDHGISRSSNPSIVRIFPSSLPS